MDYSRARVTGTIPSPGLMQESADEILSKALVDTVWLCTMIQTPRLRLLLSDSQCDVKKIGG